jgi:hypothetical protein
MGRGYTTSARIMGKGQKTEKKLNEETTAKSQHTMRLRLALLSTKVEKILEQASAAKSTNRSAAKPESVSSHLKLSSHALTWTEV